MMPQLVTILEDLISTPQKLKDGCGNVCGNDLNISGVKVQRGEDCWDLQILTPPNTNLERTRGYMMSWPS